MTAADQPLGGEAPGYPLPDAPLTVTPAPPLLRAYQDGAVDLERELARRFPAAPLLSIARLHDLGDGAPALASIAAQDGSAALHVELDAPTGDADWTFALAAMLGLRFTLRGLSALDRQYALERVRLGEGRVAFFWSAARWDADYLIAVAQRYATALYAFSPRGQVAACRLTPDAARTLVDWLEGAWSERRAPAW